MLPREVRLFTWVDVEDVLLQERPNWPSALLDAEVYWDGLRLVASNDEKADVLGWIAETFEPRFEETGEDGASILLESSNGERRRLPVALEIADETDRASVAPSDTGFEATFARPRRLVRAGGPSPAPSPLEDSDGVPVLAFHSYKGGVGRTLHAVALARWLARTGARVLLVDGDFEAPGITWHWASLATDPPVSYSDFLALLHADPDPLARSSILLVADRLRQYEDDGLLVLPAFRTRTRWTSLEIRPDHVASPGDPFALTDRLARLGRACDATAVIVDLRAGLSELSAGLLLDPRVQRVFVASLSAQSIEGTESLLERLAESQPEAARDDFPLASLAFSLVPEDLLGTSKVQEAERRLLEAGGRLFGFDDDEASGEPVRLFTPLDQRLVALPLPWEELMGRLGDTGLVDAMDPLGREISTDAAVGHEESTAEDLTARRQSLLAIAERMEYAEQSGGGGDFLVTESLQRLALDHRRDVPIVLMIGAKGAGKTYTYLQLLAAQQWTAFVEKIDSSAETSQAAQATIFGALPPANLGSEAKKLVERATRRCAAGVSEEEPMDPFQIQDRIRVALREPSWHEGDWRRLWLDILAWRCGLEPPVTD